MQPDVDNLDIIEVLIDRRSIQYAERVCFFAHYDQDGVVAPHVLHYLAALRQCGFVTVVISTAALSVVEQEKVTAAGYFLILRSNKGMDIGGWIEACIRLFPIEARFLLLANDSVYGPLSDIGDLIDRLTKHEADFYGLVESREVHPHLQSWFLLFRRHAYSSKAFADVMCRPMVHVESKGELIARYEVGLSRALVEAGLRYYAMFPSVSPGGIAARYPYNAAHLLWREMIAAGVPFIKVELLRYNLARVTDLASWRDIVEEVSPEMVDLIDHDLKRRGIHSPVSFGKMSYRPPIYWPELRGLLLADYRMGAENGRSGRIKALLRRMVISSLLRRIYIAIDYRLSRAGPAFLRGGKETSVAGSIHPVRERRRRALRRR
jgi:hypothetical protein